MLNQNGIRAAIVTAAALAVLILLPPAASRAEKPSPPVQKPHGTFFTLDTSYCQAAVPAGDSLWVSCYGDVKAVYAVQAATGKLTGRVDFGTDFPGGVAFDGKHLWVQSGGSGGFYLNKIDVKSRKVVARLRYGVKGGAAVGFDGKHVWVTDDSRAFRVNPVACTIEATVSLAANSYIKSMAYDGTSIWLLDTANGNLFRIDPSAAKVTGRLVVAPSPRMNSMAYDGSHLWVAGRRGILVYKIDPRRLRIVKTLYGDDGGGVAFDGRYVWVSYNTDETLFARINPASCRVTAVNGLMVPIYNFVTASGRLWIVSGGGLFRMPAGK